MIFNVENLPLEERLILLCLRGCRSAAEKIELAGMFEHADGSRLQDVARKNKVERPVAEALVRELGSGLADNPWREIAERNGRRVVFMETVAASLFDELHACSVRGAMFEAAGVLYSSGLPRAGYGSGDFDVLVEESGLATAQKLLLDLGLKAEEREGRTRVERQEFRGTTPEGEDFWIDVGCNPFERDRLPLRYPNPMGRWLARAVPSRKNPQIFALKPEDLLAQVAVHTSLHSYVRPPGVRLHMDVDRMVRDNAIDWDEFHQEIHALGFVRRAHYSLISSRELLATPVPDSVTQSGDPGRIRNGVISRLLRPALFGSAHKNGRLGFSSLALLELVIAEEHPAHSLSKRGMDLLGATFGLLLLAPVLAVAAVSIRLTMGSPVLFRQVRPGLNERPFTILKFRTMKPAQPGEVWFRTDEQRLTRLGKVLRKTSIDELPELLNVLKGEMSLIGPRPLLTEYLEKYTAEERRRHDVKPGITGWAQVNGRQNIPFSKRLELDVWYVDHWNMVLDLKILFMTVASVFKATGIISGQDVDDVDDIGLSSDRSRSDAKSGEPFVKRLDADLQLRKPEPKDGPALYLFKNDPAIVSLLGGFHCGMSQAEILNWIETHNARKDEVVWVVADANSDLCLGHVGLYKIDSRIRSAEFAILLGKQDQWGQGWGRKITKFVVEYGFTQLNLNRIALTVLENNERARKLYESLGFVKEGVLRSAQFKDGKYLDLICYALLREEFDAQEHV